MKCNIILSLPVDQKIPVVHIEKEEWERHKTINTVFIHFIIVIDFPVHEKKKQTSFYLLFIPACLSPVMRFGSYTVLYCSTPLIFPFVNSSMLFCHCFFYVWIGNLAFSTVTHNSEVKIFEFITDWMTHTGKLLTCPAVSRMSK